MDLTEFLGVSRDDPRYHGEGPCPDHPTVSAEFNPRTWDLVWGGNAYCRYALCRERGLRLGYRPKIGAPMTKVRHDRRHHVRMALRLAETESSGSALMSHCLMNSLIASAVLQDKREGSLPHRVRKAGNRPRSSPAASCDDRSQWVELSPRGVTPEKMAQTEALLKQSEERETALAARLATLDRQMGMSAPVPPSPEKKSEDNL